MNFEKLLSEMKSISTNKDKEDRHIDADACLEEVIELLLSKYNTSITESDKTTIVEILNTYNSFDKWYA